ncbi:cation-translocating P-type ATPase [Hydrogenophaga sp.]|uniref:cation-translocating P-type ATPase n=1 Tax=Hydrogenophaga sp. TaxID=1904254 RepID=UPI0035B28B83
MSQRQIPKDRIPDSTTANQGLTPDQVIAAQRTFGFNDIIAQTAGNWRDIARDTARDPMLWFLVLSAALFAGLGQLTESLTLVLAMLPLLGMDAYLHRRTAASSAGLASRLASEARVLRNGQWTDLAARELVPGDLVEVRPGEYFPADGILVAGSDLQVDESTLTGESLPVAKRAIPPSDHVPAMASEDRWGTAGTRLLTGTAWLRVLFTGGSTRYGEIVRSATEGRHEATPLQKAIGELVVMLLAAALIVCVVLAAVRLWQGHGWIDALLSAVTLAVAAIPEEFPVVYTFFLGMGVFRLARKNALVRRAVAVENIGRTSCIVSDKTGTITAGELLLSDLAPDNGLNDDRLLQVAKLAARTDSGDPLDQALHSRPGKMPQARLLASFPFTEARRRETAVWAMPDGTLQACTKGAPETVLSVCSLSAQDQSRWLDRVGEHARSGRKVIACAYRSMEASEPSPQEPAQGFTFAGLLAFEDPVRDGVREAVAQCMTAGMRVIMVTGDHPATAIAIARSIGLGGGTPTAVVMEAEDDPKEILQQHPAIDVVARATPSQKLVLVQALQSQGELVAVTGDGVNDVPALRQADIGVAMGARGTRSAREVAPVVLLDDNFRTIVDAVAEGRQLFQNLRLAFAYLLLIHLPLVIGAAAIPLMGLPLLFLPIHIVWLELVIHPTAMLAFQDLPSSGPLAKVQRHRSTRFFPTGVWVGIGLIGSLISLAVIWSYLHALGADRDVAHARAMALTMLLVASAGITTGLSRLVRSSSRWPVFGTLLSVLVLVQIPPISHFLNLRPLHPQDWMICFIGFAAITAGTLLLARRLTHVPGNPDIPFKTGEP